MDNKEEKIDCEKKGYMSLEILRDIKLDSIISRKLVPTSLENYNGANIIYIILTDNGSIVIDGNMGINAFGPLGGSGFNIAQLFYLESGYAGKDEVIRYSYNDGIPTYIAKEDDKYSILNSETNKWYLDYNKYDYLFNLFQYEGHKYVKTKELKTK